MVSAGHIRERQGRTTRLTGVNGEKRPAVTSPKQVRLSLNLHGSGDEGLASKDV